MGHAYARMAIQAKTATKHPMWNVLIGIIIVVTIKYAALLLLHQVIADAVQIICSAREVVFFVASDLGASASEYGLEHCSFRCETVETSRCHNTGGATIHRQTKDKIKDIKKESFISVVT